MAYCGKDFADNKKDEDPVVDHSLKNIVAFSTANMQMCCVNIAEGLLKRGADGNFIDRRTKINFNDPKIHHLRSYAVLCQIVAILPGSKDKVLGSGIQLMLDDLVNLKGKRKFGRYIVTCAHNVTGYSPFKEKSVVWKPVNVYSKRQGEKSWFEFMTANEKGVDIHPKYDGQKPFSGYDVAVFRKIKSEDKLDCKCSEHPIRDLIWLSPDPLAVQKGLSIEIAGYPGEKNGQPYYHHGEILKVKESSNGGYIIWHNVDVTPGNSGSPIMITDKKWISKFGKSPGISKAIIGIHTGQNLCDHVNYGILFSPSLFKWILGEQLSSRVLMPWKLKSRSLPTLVSKESIKFNLELSSKFSS